MHQNPASWMIFNIFSLQLLTFIQKCYFWLFIIQMIANIPFSLTECLAPKEVGELLEVAEHEQRPVEDLVVFAIRDFLVAHRKPASTPSSGGTGPAAVMAA